MLVFMIVYHASGKIHCKYEGANSARTMNLSYQNGNHFNSVCLFDTSVLPDASSNRDSLDSDPACSGALVNAASAEKSELSRRNATPKKRTNSFPKSKLLLLQKRKLLLIIPTKCLWPITAV